jgi:hypothetical protein
MVVHEKLMFTQLIKRFAMFYGPERFAAVKFESLLGCSAM